MHGGDAGTVRATPEQVDAHLRELASSYEYPDAVVNWYKSNPDRLAEIEAIVLENNVADFIFGQARVTPKTIGFAELMGQG